MRRQVCESERCQAVEEVMERGREGGKKGHVPYLSDRMLRGLGLLFAADGGHH